MTCFGRFFNEYKALSPKLYDSKRTVETVEAILGELDQKLNEMVEDRERSTKFFFSLPIVFDDWVVFVTNCMSGKDRTGMSVTLEQARLLAQYHVLATSCTSLGCTSYRGTARDDESKTGVLKQSRVMHIADMMRVYGVRLQCRKNSVKRHTRVRW